VEVKAPSGVIVQSFVFDPARGGFVRAAQLETTGIVVHFARQSYDQSG